MAQTSNGSITITDLTDITDVYLEYCMAADSITTAEDIIAKTIWTPPEREWSTEYPTWQSGYQIWIREVTKKEGIAQLEYGTPYLDKAVNQINNNISNIQTKIKKIWSNSTGSYMASGIGGNDVIESNVNTYGFNSKFTTTGISFNYNATPLTSLGTDGLKLYDSNNIPIAQFSDTGITMGKSNNSQSYLFEDYHSLQMIDKEGETYFYINDLRNSKGIASESFRADLLARDVFNIVDRNILSLRIYYWGEMGLSEPVELTNILNISNYTVDGHLYKIELPSAPQSSFSLRINYKADWTQYETKTFNCDGNTRVFYIDETTRNNIYNWQALVDDEGWHCIHYKNETLTSISFYDEVSGIYEFQYTTDTPLKNYTLGIRQSTGKKGNYSVVEGYNNMASGDYSHAEGYGTTANININNPSSPKIAAHAEGYQTTAGGNASHSEGSHTTARGDDSHAEGNNTDAYGEASHAEGGSTNAYGKYSHAGGYCTIADSEAQTVIGKHNIGDRNNKYAFIIGNGTSSPSNALTVDWQGNMSLPTGHIDTIDMTTTEISNFIAELNVSGAPINTTQDDWVVEQGMSGIWAYRKWQSGTVDCLFGSTTITGSTGALYLYRAGNIVFLSSNGAFRSSSSSIATTTKLSQTIPSGFRPIAKSYNMSVSATKNWRLEIASTGDIYFYGDTAWNSGLYLSGVWVTNDNISV